MDIDKEDEEKESDIVEEGRSEENKAGEDDEKMEEIETALDDLQAMQEQTTRNATNPRTDEASSGEQDR